MTCQQSKNFRIPSPRVAAVNDLSGFGRCSLAVAIGALSAMGAQPVALPTAVLSTHTGGFGSVEKRDLTDFLAPCAAHWERVGLRFDAVLTGYMATVEQADIAASFLRSQNGALRVVDPVMGDGGRMYKSLPDDMPRRMWALCREADWITPNATEMFLLAEEPYVEGPLTERRARALLQKVRLATGAKAVLFTGASLETGWANLWLANGAQGALPFTKEPGAYPGTGDLFAAIVTGALVQGASIEEAVGLASEFVAAAVRRTNALGTDPREGVQFEALLGRLCRWREERKG